jgi:hypothetical protein
MQAALCERCSDRSSVGGAIGYEIIGPDMVRVLRPAADARPVVEPEPSALRLVFGELQALFSPGSLHAFVVHAPARPPQEVGGSSVAVASVLAGKGNNPWGPRDFIIGDQTGTALGRPVLANHPAGLAFTDVQRTTRMLDGMPASG